MSQYAAAYDGPQGPGDARPTALQITRNQNLAGNLVGKSIISLLEKPSVMDDLSLAFVLNEIAWKIATSSVDWAIGKLELQKRWCKMTSCLSEESMMGDSKIPSWLGFMHWWGRGSLTAGFAPNRAPGRGFMETREKETPYVETGQISEAKIGCKYVALSYVWGKESSSPKNTNDFPSVVSDAISVTRDLGCRYLWVDRYCINQESEHKQHMINQMDRVYSHAFITIIAAAGNDPGYGLPGISRPRPVQGLATVGGTHLIELWDDGLDIVKNKTQAYYLSLDDMSETLKRFHWMIPPYYKSDCWTFHYSLGPHIEEYSARNLSYDGDGLNAFLGILNHYESLNTDLRGVVSHFWGIPILLTLGIDDVLFDLLWRHRKVAATRRLDFPSWSWVGWTGAIEFAWKPMHFAMTTPSSRRLMDSAFDAIDESQSSIENTAWSISISSHGKICELPDFFCRGDQRFSNQKELWITALVLRMRFREVDAKTCATFLVRDDIFVAIPVLFDTPFDADIHTFGLLLPRGGGGRHRYTNCPIYTVIILQKVGENRFERAGILDLQCSYGILDLKSSDFHGRLSIHEKTILNAKDEIVKEEVEPVDYLFLRGAEKRSFLFV
ncbi:hypothetical protein FDECE_17688 [Fusarium decemcellulare]|nr:hypothetical protein FDECE_17688 [Fusarium decemcellulare]